MKGSPKQRKRSMNDDVFQRKFKPITSPGDSQMRNRDELDPKFADPHHVWSAVDGDSNENMYLIPGYHVVNHVGYVQTEVPWTDEDEKAGLQVLYFKPSR